MGSTTTAAGGDDDDGGTQWSWWCVCFRGCDDMVETS